MAVRSSTSECFLFRPPPTDPTVFQAHLRGLYGMSSLRYRQSFREGSEMIALASNSKSAQTFMFSEDGKYMLKTAVRVYWHR